MAYAEAAVDSPDDILAAKFSEVLSLKEAGNEALKSKDLPLATDRYEEALQVWEEALTAVPQGKPLVQNELVRYSDHGYGVIEKADVIFKDYVVTDCGSGNEVKHRVGKYEDVITKFKRKELLFIPPELFELRIALLQNITLVALKLARASMRQADFESVVMRANAALVMNGTSAKASMRKGEALMHLQDVEGAMKALVTAAQETKGKDEEVNRLLQIVLEAKGKGKGKGRGRGRGRQNFQSRYANKREDGGDQDPSDCAAGCCQHPQCNLDGISVSSSSDGDPVADTVGQEEAEDGGHAGAVDAPALDDAEDIGLAEVDEDALKTLNTRPTPRPDGSSRSAAGTNQQTGLCTRRRAAIVVAIAVVIIFGNAVFFLKGGNASVEL